MTIQRINFEFGTVEADVLTGTEGRDLVFGYGGNDTISTGDGDDRVFAGLGNDLIDAGDGDDRVYGGRGDDTMVGGLGNDRFFGGLGYDVVTYDGSIDDYQVTLAHLSLKRTIIEAIGDVNDNGRDFLIGVEAVFFIESDYTLLLDGRNNVVLAGDDVASVEENGLLTLQAADLLSNDFDFDDDALEITSVDGTSASGANVTLANGEITYDPGTAFDDLGTNETATDTFTYIVDDGRGGTDTATVTVTITGANDAPSITANNAMVAENTTAVEAGIVATDVDSDTLTFALGGADSALFAIDPVTGALNFISAPDFEAPQDANLDNAYEVTVSVSDGETSASEDIVISVGDVDETPTIVARINEFHYDNTGSDTGEFIEVRVNTGADASALALTLYNGSNGTVYNTLSLPSDPAGRDADYDYYVVNLPSNGLQNGAAASRRDRSFKRRHAGRIPQLRRHVYGCRRHRRRHHIY